MSDPTNPLRSRRAGVSAGGVLAAVVLLVVLVVGFLLIRGGGGAEVDEGARTGSEALQQGFDAAEARARLETLRGEVEAGLDEAALRERYLAVRGDLEAAYAEAEGEAGEVWARLGPRLEELGDQIGTRTREAAATIDAMIDDLPAE